MRGQSKKQVHQKKASVLDRCLASFQNVEMLALDYLPPIILIQSPTIPILELAVFVPVAMTLVLVLHSCDGDLSEG